MLILLVFAFPMLDMRLGQPDDGNQPEDKTQRIAYDRLSEGFGAGSNGPFLIAVDIPDTGPEADADLENPHSATGDQSITEASLPKPPRRRGVFFPMVVGGAVAAGLGFGAATVILPRFLTLPLPPTSAISDLDERLRSQSERIIAQTAQIDALKSDTTIADLAADQSEAITGIETQLTALNDLLVSNLAQVADQANALGLPGLGIL